MDRNGNGNVVIRLALLSLSARRAWIEIISYASPAGFWLVALRKESVDRNVAAHFGRRKLKVALRKESVDRNKYWPDAMLWSLVSLSARRAWIEIL